MSDTHEKIVKNDSEWREELEPERYNVMFEEGTEPPGSSPLNFEKRDGFYLCAACEQPLFESDTKYESGSGWPSFFKAIPGALEFSTDYKIGVARTEYHCSRCGSHQGHLFEDGPKPTGQRYCNNGLSLQFAPQGKADQAQTNQDQSE
ncbi:MAG: peptide-methionine (R)-S-oxide reductase MsrB [Trueperaceae bacterium]